MYAYSCSRTRPAVLTALLATATAATLLQPGHSAAQQARVFRPEAVANPTPAFQVRLRADRTDLTYEEGEDLILYFRSTRDCYLYLFNRGPTGNDILLFPNQFQSDNFVQAKREIQIPGPDAGFHLPARPPFGQEHIIAIATTSKKPVSTIKRMWKRGFSEKGPTPLARDVGVEPVVEELRTEFRPSEWAEHHIRVMSVRRGGRATLRSTRRVAVIIALAEYEDRFIPRLPAAHGDALKMNQLLSSLCGFEVIGLLINEEATEQEVEHLILNRLAAETRPGDTILIYWTGHGGRTGDISGDEVDGLDEYLVLYDSVKGRPNTMLLDDRFAMWLASLDGRRIVLILDTCHGSGAAKGIKGIGEFERPLKGDTFDFLDGELNQAAKDLGRTNAAMLAACRADQDAFQRPDRKMSVMTYYLAEAIERLKPLTLRQAHRYLTIHVPPYVRKFCDGAEQTPVLEGGIIVDQIYLRE